MMLCFAAVAAVGQWPKQNLPTSLDGGTPWTGIAEAVCGNLGKKEAADIFFLFFLFFIFIRLNSEFLFH